MPRSPITTGKDFNFFRKVDSSSTFFTETALIAFNFKGLASFSLVNEGAGVVEYSFNGNTLHGDMIPGTVTASLFFDNRRVSKIWFRSPGGGTNTMRIEAWAAM